MLIYNSKDVLRQAILKIRTSLSDERLDKMSDNIEMEILSISEFTRANTIAGYHSIGSEVRTLKILNRMLQMKKILVLPKVIDTMIVFAQVKDLIDDLEVGKYKIMTPKDDCEQVENVDLVFVPGIVWDEWGHRIGYGHGYYDRCLSRLQATSIGLAYDFQVFDEIPYEKNDFRVDMIVTDRRIIVAK